MTTATFAIGKALSSVPIQVFGCVMACLLIVAWASIFFIMVRAVLLKDILWPQKQEEKKEVKASTFGEAEVEDITAW